MAICKPGSMPSPDTGSAGTLTLGFLAFRTMGNICCLSHLVSANLLWLLELKQNGK